MPSSTTTTLKKPTRPKNQFSSNDTLSGNTPYTPTYSKDAEKAILGAMIAHPDTIEIVVEKIMESDFFVPAHQIIYSLICEMRDAESAIEIVAIHQKLSDRKLAKSLGSPGIIAELAAAFVSHLNIHTYIQIVKDKSLLRQLQSACTLIAQSIADESDKVSSILDQAEKSIFNITNMHLAQTSTCISDEIGHMLKMIENFQKHKGKLLGIPTPFGRLDEYTTGWQKGEMIVLAARPGVGKTALGLSLATFAARKRYDEKSDSFVGPPGYPVGIFSLEMTNEQLMLRILASAASISLSRIRSGKLDERELKAVELMAKEIKEWPIYLDDSSFLTIHQLRAKARRMKQKFDIQFLVVDYLQLVNSDSNQAKDSRQNEIAEVSRGIKALAKELAIPILVLAQLNRKSEEGKTEPALHNLRESGAIEQDADIVMLLHRHEQKEDEPASPTYDYSLIIAKQRNGPTGKVDLIFQSGYTRFEEPVRRPES